MFHLEDIVEETGYVLEQDSEYCQRFLEDEEEVSVSVTQKGGKALQYQVWLSLLLSITFKNAPIWQNEQLFLCKLFQF